MKSKTKHSIFFKGIVFAVAFALTVLCFPMEALLAFADEPYCKGDYHTLTLGGGDEGVKTEVTVGGQYQIPDAYIGGDEGWKIGDKAKQSGQLSEENAQLVSSKVEVTYFGQVVTSSADTNEAADQNEGKRKQYNGSFDAENVGTYVITYSYTFTEDGGDQITNTYELNVTSSISQASVNLEYENISLAPSSQTTVIDYSVKGARVGSDNLKNIDILLPEVCDENGEKIALEDITFVAGKEGDVVTDETVQSVKEKAEKVVLISVTGGNNAKSVEVQKDEENGSFYIAGSTFQDTQFGEGLYTIKFSYFIRSQKPDGSGTYHFVTSNTKSFNVRGVTKKSDGTVANPYYDKYDLEIALESDWQNYNNGETGVEKELPKPIGLTSDETNPASEQVDVAYSVKVLYKKDFEGDYVELSEIKAEGSEDSLYKDILNLDDKSDTFTYGTLKDATKFKPLQDGYYSFVYTIRDFYGNTVSNSNNGKIGYEYLGTNNKGITDKTKPTPIVYDASVKVDNYDDIKDEDWKARTYATANGVVVYAIGMKDNHSKHDDENVNMYRRFTYDGVHQFTIEDYDEYNLIFNYRSTKEHAAWENLKTNNFNIEKEVRKLDSTEQKVDSDIDMLKWLAGNNSEDVNKSNGGYKIVVDNANAEQIFKIFSGDDPNKETNNAGSENFFVDKKLGEADITAENFIEWVQTEDGKNAGFAYIDTDKTFGYYDSKSKDETKGFGYGTFKIEYVVKDAAGNEASKDVSITLVSDETDTDAPTLTFKTSLKSTYLPTDIVTFDAPTSTDFRDTKMNEVVLYRYLDESDKPISLKKVGENGKPAEENRATTDLDELWIDLEDVWENNLTLQNKYKEYHDDDETDDGYFDITDSTASTYSIDLNEVSKFAAAEGKVAKKLQIFVYVYDDAGNPAVYAETVEIANTIDNHPPRFKGVIESEEEGRTYYRGEEIKLSALEFADDAVEFMKYEVKVTYTNGSTKIDVPVMNDYQERDGWDLKYIVHPGSFVASHAGDYQVAIKVSDGKENTIVHFQNFHVLQRNLIQPPVINSTLAKSQTVEIEGDSNYDPSKGIELPTPTISYDIPNSVTYDVYSKNKGEYGESSDVQFVVLGVKENGSIETSAYSVSQGENNRFIPKALGEYEIKYNVRVRVYDFHKFTLNERAVWDDASKDYKEGGTLTYKKSSSAEDNETATVKFASEANTFEVTVKNDANSIYKVVVGSDSKVVVYDSKGSEVTSETEGADFFKDAQILQDLGTLRNYVLESEVYRVTVVDTKAPEMKELPYAKAISKEKMEADEKLLIYGIQVNPNKAGINDVDVEKCSIVVYYTLPNGREGGRQEYKGSEAFQDHEYKDFPSTIHATYTIRYTLWDKNNNSNTSHVYTIAVGDVTPPTMTFPDEFVKDSYEIGVTKELKVDLSKITFQDAGVEAEDADSEDKFEYRPTATLRNKSTNEEIAATDESGDLILFYPLDNVGTYVLTIEVQDAVGNTATQTFEFEVVSKTADTTMTYQVIGTVLIVISVLVLAGVIIYFIVSKVKLDKELKK